MSIFKRAKVIYKKGGTWQGAIKKAAAELRAGKRKPAAKKKSAAKRKVAPKKKAAKRRKISGVMDGMDNIRYAAAISGTGRAVGSVAHHIGKAKLLIGEKIAGAELRKFQAKKKTAKKKIAKSIAAYKVQYRKLG